MPKTITNDYALVPAADTGSSPYGWGSLTFLADADSGASEHVSLLIARIQAGQSNMLHRHPNCDELLHLLQGHIRHQVGDKWVEMRAGDTLRVTQGVAHRAQVLGTEEAVMLVVYSAGRRETETVEE